MSLKDGEASILGGLIETDVIKNVNGIPGAAQIPIFRYLFSDNSKEVKNNEVLIVITPHVIRFPSITADNLRTIASGTDTEARVYHDEDESYANSASAAHADRSYGSGATSTSEPAAKRRSGRAVAFRSGKCVTECGGCGDDRRVRLERQ